MLRKIWRKLFDRKEPIESPPEMTPIEKQIDETFDALMVAYARLERANLAREYYEEYGRYSIQADPAYASIQQEKIDELSGELKRLGKLKREGD